MKPIISVENLDKFFGKLHVLKDLTFSISTAEVVSVIGRSGSGKSTLLRCLNFLENPHHGTISIDGISVRADLHRRTHRKKIHELRLKTGMVFQSFNLFPHKTALENVIEAPMIVKRLPKSEAIEIGLELIEKVGLIEKRDEYPSRLSGGQQQRIAIARALAMRPKVMLFDEPTSALDPELVIEVLNVIRQLVIDGMTMLIVTHEMGFAREISDRVIFMHDGEIIEIAPPKQIFNNPENKLIQSFI